MRRTIAPRRARAWARRNRSALPPASSTVCPCRSNTMATGRWAQSSMPEDSLAGLPADGPPPLALTAGSSKSSLETRCESSPAPAAIARASMLIRRSSRILLACSPRVRPITIGLAGPFSDSVGAPMRRAAELAVRTDQPARAASADGRSSWSIRDDFGDPDSAVTMAAALEAAGVVAVIGHVYSGTTLAAAPVYNGAAPPGGADLPQLLRSGYHRAPATTPSAPARATCSRVRPSPASPPIGSGCGAGHHPLPQRRIRTRHPRHALPANSPARAASSMTGSLPRRYARGRSLSRAAGTAEDQPVHLRRRQLGEAATAIRAARARGIEAPFLGGDALEGTRGERRAGRGDLHLQRLSGQLRHAQEPGLRARLHAQAIPSALPPNQPAAATYDILFLLRDVIARVGTDRRAHSRRRRGDRPSTSAPSRA